MSYQVIAYDVGTTGIKTCLFQISAEEGVRFLSSEVADYSLRMLGGGAIEQDPEEWWTAMGRTTRRLLERTGVPKEEIRGISFCSQMQNVVMVDRQGRPCISWMDTRADLQFSRCMNTGLKVEGLNVFKVLKFLRDYLTKLVVLFCSLQPYHSMYLSKIRCLHHLPQQLLHFR